MLELYRLTILLRVDSAFTDFCEFGMGMYLDVIFTDVLKQTSSGLGHSVSDYVRRHFYYGYIAALNRKKHCGFGTGHAAACYDHFLTVESAAPENFNGGLDIFTVVQTRDWQEHGVAAVGASRVGEKPAPLRVRQLKMSCRILRLCSIAPPSLRPGAHRRGGADGKTIQSKGVLHLKLRKAWCKCLTRFEK